MIKKLPAAHLSINLFRALSDPTRLNIVMLLAQGELCVCQIEEALGASQAKISRHLAYLRKYKIVNVRSRWKWKYYSLARQKNQFEDAIVGCLRHLCGKDTNLKPVFPHEKTSCKILANGKKMGGKSKF